MPSARWQELGPQLQPAAARQTAKALAKARTRDSMSAFSKLTEVVDGLVRITNQAPLIVPIVDLVPGRERAEMFEGLRQLLRTYRDTLAFDRRVLLDQFELADFARKVVGVGSVGTRAWIALMLGRDGQDPLFLQVKEAEASVLEGYLEPSEFANHGQRVVTGQRLMQATSDIFLGWLGVEAGIDGPARDFYVRQLRDWKGSAEIERMIPSGMTAYGRLCGWTLARAHARSGDRIAIAAYLGRGTTFDRAHARVRDRVRRTERTRLPSAGRCRQLGHDRGSTRPLTSTARIRLRRSRPTFRVGRRHAGT